MRCLLLRSFTILAAAAIVGLTTSAASAATILVTDNGFVARSDQTYWQIPFNGGTASEFAKSTPDQPIDHLVHLGGTFFAERDHNGDFGFASTVDGIHWTPIHTNFGGRYNVVRSRLKSIFTLNGQLGAEFFYIAPFGTPPQDYKATYGLAVVCMSSDGGHQWSCNSAAPNADPGTNPLVSCGGLVAQPATTSTQTPSGTVSESVLDVSSDGLQWQQVQLPLGVMAPAQHVYCANDRIWTSRRPTVMGPMFVSELNKGHFVRKLTIKHAPNVTNIIGGGGRVIVSTFGPAYLSTNGGASFTAVRSGIDNLSKIAGTAAYGHGVFVGYAQSPADVGSGGSLVQSRNGLSWHSIP